MRLTQNKKRIIIAMMTTVFTFTFFLHNSVNAGTTTGATKATATIGKTCTISATNISFGTLNLSTTFNYANGTLQILCTKNTTYTIGMNYATADTKGYYTNGKADTGLMTGSAHGDQIAYGIQPTNNFSGASWNAITVSGTATGQIQTMTMYGAAVLGYTGYPTYPTPDNYSDNVSVTITY
jgi:spore coat protein U-like protein